MNLAQFKVPVSHMCLVGTVVASWSLTQEVAGLSSFTIITNIFVTEFTELSETFRKNANKLRCYLNKKKSVIEFAVLLGWPKFRL